MSCNIDTPLDVTSLLEIMWDQGSGKYCEHSAQGFRYVTRSGISNRVYGRGLSYDRAGQPDGGAITRIETSIDAGRLLTITDMCADVCGLAMTRVLGWRELLSFMLMQGARLEVGAAVAGLKHVVRGERLAHASAPSRQAHRPIGDRVL